jgi:NADH-quinone oxidoreductase E subunit
MSKTIESNTIKRSRLLPCLKSEQERKGYIDRQSMAVVAGQVDVPLNEAYSVATFYAFLPVAPVGRHVIRICHCLPCELKDGQAIIEGIEKKLGIAPGQVTADGKFSFELVSCIGACDQAPAMLINDKLYGNLTPESVAGILASY